MKIIIVILVLVSAFAYASAIAASYGQPLPVTSSSNTYNFPGTGSGGFFGGASAGAQLVISSSAATSASFVTVTKLSSAPGVIVSYNASSSSYALPAGFNLISGSDVGYAFNFTSDLEKSSALSAVFTIPSYSGYSNLSAQGKKLSLLSFNAAASAYAAVPDSQYSVATNNSVFVRLYGSAQFVVSAQSTKAVAVNITSSASASFYVVANSTQSYAIYQSGQLAFVISNLKCQAGSVTVGVSASASSYASLVASQGLVLVSSVYSISHSAGAGAIISADLTYNLLYSSASNFSATAATWANFQSSTSYVSIGASISGSIVTKAGVSISGDFAVVSSFSTTPLSSYNTSLSVGASVSVYSFGKAAGLGAQLFVSAGGASASSSVSVSLIAELPSVKFLFGAITSIFSLPCGFSSLSSFTGQQGFRVAFSADLQASASAGLSSRLVTPAVVNYGVIAAAGWRIVPLSFNASVNAYAALNANQYQVAANGSVSISLSASINLILAIYNPAFCAGNVITPTLSSLLLAADFTQELIVHGLGDIISFSNLTTQAGALSVQISGNAGFETIIASQSGRDLLSNVLAFTHSAGASVSFSATISFNLPGSDCEVEQSSSEEPPYYDPNGGKKRQAAGAGVSVGASASIAATQRQSAQVYNFNNVTGQWDLVVGGYFTNDGCVLKCPIGSIIFPDFSVQAAAIISASFSQILNISSNTIIYSFGNSSTSLIPYLIISATGSGPGSYINVSQVITLPTVVVSVNNATTVFNLPSGCSAIGGGSFPGFSFGLSADLQASVSAGLRGWFLVPAASIGLNASVAVGAGGSAGAGAGTGVAVGAGGSAGAGAGGAGGSAGAGAGVSVNLFNLLCFNANAQAFAKVDSSKYSVAADGSLNVSLGACPGTLLFAKCDSSPSANVFNFGLGISANFLIAANANQGFTIQQGGSAAVQISGFAADSGALTISGSANAQVEANAAASAGNTLVSNIYGFNHSAGVSAVHSAQLAFNISASSVTGVDLSTLSWFRFNTSTNAWDEQPSSVQGSGSAQALVTSTSFLANDWSVQQKSMSTSGSSSATPSSNVGNGSNGTGNPAGTSTGSGAGLRANPLFLSALEFFLLA